MTMIRCSPVIPFVHCDSFNTTLRSDLTNKALILFCLEYKIEHGVLGDEDIDASI